MPSPTKTKYLAIIHPSEFSPHCSAAMAVVSKHSLLHHILLHFLLVAAGCACLEEKLLSVHELQWGERCLPQFASTRRTRRNSGAIVLEMRQQHLSRTNNHQEDRNLKLLMTDDARVSSIHSRIKNPTSKNVQKSTSEAQVPLVSGVKLQTLNYVVTIAVGGRNTTVIVDTGSDLTWVQCKPCLYCYAQQDPLFDPSTSASYQNITCDSTTCFSLQAATGSVGACATDRSICNYLVSYGDGSYSRGVLGRENINVGGTSIENFVFGCGLRNRGLFGGTSGIMGLGRTQLSLVSQTTSQFGGVFSYCLPTRLFSSSGSLVLGDDPTVYRNSTPISYTTMMSDPQQEPFYFLNLTDMSVGGVALQASGFSNGKILIDSGTVITRLAPSIYKALKTEFVKQFFGYPPAASFSILDTCFNLSAYEEVRVPKLRLGFDGGVAMNVDGSGMFYFAKKDASQVCLAVASLQYEDQIGIIGNYQQKNQRVVYDTMASKIGFAEEACS